MNVVNRRRILKLPVNTITFSTINKKSLYFPNLNINIIDMQQSTQMISQEHNNNFYNYEIINTNRE